MAKETIVPHLRRIEGQIKGLQKMIEADRPCDEVLTQIMAAKAALDRVTSDLVASHMEACFDGQDPAVIKATMAKTIHLLCKR
jgi:DNA-binding FrmR family transcriptional regulator